MDTAGLATSVLKAKEKCATVIEIFILTFRQIPELLLFLEQRKVRQIFRSIISITFLCGGIRQFGIIIT